MQPQVPGSSADKPLMVGVAVGRTSGETVPSDRGRPDVSGENVFGHGPRRCIVAVVDGKLGDQIQAWRERYDARHARLLPPHLTLCYRPPDAPLADLEAQVRHAFTRPVQVRLGPVFVLSHREAPLAVSIRNVEELEEARQRLFDGTYIQMGGRHEWPWHITCIRYGYKRDCEALLASAAQELALDTPWLIERVSYLELRDGRYRPVAEWDLNLDGVRVSADPARETSRNSCGPQARTDASR